MKSFLKFIISSILLYFGYKDYYDKVKVENGNNTLISTFLSTANYYLSSDNDIVTLINTVDITHPEMMLYKPIKDYKTEEFYYFKNDLTPRVYIYSTHPTERYLNDYNVIDASLLLQSKLNTIGIQTLVESRSASEYIRQHNLDYDDSYTATREFLKTTLNKYGDFDLIIDLHRDSVPNGVVTKTNINNKNYAKIMFVMNKNYANYEFALKINNVLSAKYNGISRGIYDKHQGHFNQDLNSKNILIELGTSDNTKEEIENSVEALAATIKEILNEQKR